jgi:peptide deformylase
LNHGNGSWAVIVPRESADLSLLIVAVVPIRIVGDPVLHTATSPVPVGPDGSLPAELAELIADLYETMDEANGVGLAANQIGVSQRVFVYDCADERGLSSRRRGVIVNPVLETSDIPETMPDPDNDDEGCLSVPGESFPRGRADWARVTGLDADGDPVTLEGTGLFARMLQHETGHLDGFLYVDGLIGRHARAAKRAVKAQGWGVPGLSWTPGEGPDPFGH